MLAALLVAVLTVGMAPAQAAPDTPAFRVVDVRAEYGQLILEVEHFGADGRFWFFEAYTWQGREGGRHPRALDSDGYVLLNNGDRAPLTVGPIGTLVPYAPVGTRFMRSQGLYVTEDAVLAVIQQTHAKRAEFSNRYGWAATGGTFGIDSGTEWTRGQHRLTVKPLDGSLTDYAYVDRLVDAYAHLIGRAYTADLAPYAGTLPPVAPPTPGVTEYGTVSTFYPDDHAESTSVDGDATEGTDASWSTLRGAAGDTASSNAASLYAQLVATSSSNVWSGMARGITLFDTSGLPDGDAITSAVLKIYTEDILDGLSPADSLSLVTTTPASNTNIVGADYAQFGSTKQAADLPLSGLSDDAYNSFTLNATGLGNISKTGITKFGIRLKSDTDNSEPTWSSGASRHVQIAAADESIGGEARPALVVTHLAISAAVTGTVGDGATEQEVRDGGGTIILTLTNDTWVSAGGTFNGQRQAIINGLDSAQSEAAGWDAEVKGELPVTAVARTSDTVVTVTLGAADVAGYSIGSNEVITATVPAAALVLAGATVASPTFTIAAGNESAAVTGTLSNDGVPAEIVAGGQTIIITLSNTKWVSAGGTFNGQRQAILDGLVAVPSDQAGWNAQAFAVGNVVRTSDTVVTITLAAESDYAIPATETITTTIPAAAVVYPAAIPAPPTFDIVPAFKASGVRVTPAINLSGVTNVAYCALGWDAVTPTGTTVTVETSINGGTDYSTASNGSCPTGIAEGATLAGISDFRIRVTLATTNSAVTPLIQTLALIVDDDSGTDVRYQLHTTPGATIADRTGSGYTGTMSYPVAPAGMASDTAPFRTTRAGLTTEQARTSSAVVSAATGSATNDNLFNLTETGFTGLPGDGLVTAMSEAGSGLPKRFIWFIFIGLGVIGGGAVALLLTRSMLWSAAVMAGLIGFTTAIGDGLMPGWIIFVFVAVAGVLILIRPGKVPV